MSFYSLGDSFKWFVARVVDIKDPEYLGRIKIRVIHDQTGQLGKKKKTYGLMDDDLLWAYTLSSINSASLSWKKVVELEGYDVPNWIDAVGLSPTGIAVGSYAFGFYLDGHEQNIPLIFSTYHKLSVYPEPPTDAQTGEMLQTAYPQEDKAYFDIAALARGFVFDPDTEESHRGQTLPKEPYSVSSLWKSSKTDHAPIDEFPTAYNTEYPYNTTYTTKAGHAIELDDTVGAERIHVWHKSGSYEEISSGSNPQIDDDDTTDWPLNGPVGYTYITAGGTAEDEYDGRRSRKTMDSFFDVVVKDKNELTLRDHNVETANTETVKIGNSAHWTVGYKSIPANRNNAGGDLGELNHFFDVANNYVQTSGNNHLISVGYDTQKKPEGEFNQLIHIANNQITAIANNQTVTIGHNQTVDIGDNCTVTVGKNCTIIVKGDASISVDGSTDVYSKGSMKLETANNMTIKAGGTLNMTSTGAMTIDGSTVSIG